MQGLQSKEYITLQPLNLKTVLRREDLEGECSSKSKRNKTPKPENWKRNVEKKLRYLPHTEPPEALCSHKTKAKSFQCDQIDKSSIRDFHDKFYSNTEKVAQDFFILQHIKIMPVKRRRPSSATREKKIFNLKYFVPVGQQLVPVCRVAFLNILCIKKHRVWGIAERLYKNKQLPTENRGGDRRTKLYIEKKVAVENYINSFKDIDCSCLQNALNAPKLPESSQNNPNEPTVISLYKQLNIKMLWEKYNGACEEKLKVKQSYFRNIFHMCVEKGIDSFAAEICSKCLEEWMYSDVP